jgi:transposase-like protein
MLLVLYCPRCGKRYELDGSLAGKEARCHECGAVFQVPEPSRPAPQSSTRKSSWPANSSSWSGTIFLLCCPRCSKRQEVDGAFAGKKWRCVECGEHFSVPEPRRLATGSGSGQSDPSTAPPDWDLVLDDGPSSSEPAPGTTSSDREDAHPSLVPPRAGLARPRHRPTGPGRATKLGVTVGLWYFLAGLLLCLAAVFCLWLVAGSAGHAVW